MKTEQPQGPNLMVSRHGASENALQKCAQCRYLTHTTEASSLCERCTLPSGHKMPWSEQNAACGLFEERMKEKL